MDDFFFDVHCHTMTLGHVNLMSFLKNLQSNAGFDLFESLTGNNVIAEKGLGNIKRRSMNLLGVMQNDLKEIFFLMEDDLRGKFISDGSDPILQEEGLAIGGRKYRRIVLTPLLMDFKAPPGDPPGTYYPDPGKAIDQVARDYAFAIAEYRKERPNGIFLIKPFLGINPVNYSLSEFTDILHRYFGHYKQSKKNRFGRRRYRRIFYGLKLYPPMGFDPWPSETENPKEAQKVRYLYEFASKLGIPITTHCNDSGFITVDYKRAMEYTHPLKWDAVLSRYPELRLNLAHFGAGTESWRRKVAAVWKRESDAAWSEHIIVMMEKYPNLYSDFSFCGVRDTFYKRLSEILEGLPQSTSEIVSKRLLFGSDFMINLSSVDSYLDYYRKFDISELSDSLKNRFTSVNPSNFLRLKS